MLQAEERNEHTQEIVGGKPQLLKHKVSLREKNNTKKQQPNNHK